MRAALFTGSGTLELDDVEVAVPAPGQVGGGTTGRSERA